MAVRPVTTSEVLLQQAVDVLSDIRDLLRQAPPAQPEPAATDAPSPAAVTVTEPAPARKRPAKKTTTPPKEG